jgi:HAD superfamily hydrolase (TIGR01549 family)
MAIKAVIFDMDDTLLQTFKIKSLQLIEAGKRFYNIEITEEKLMQKWGQPYQEVLNFIFDYVEPFESIQKNYMSLQNEFQATAHPDVIDTLKSLKDAGYILGLLTAAARENVIIDLAHSKIDASYFFKIQSADDTSMHKPDPRVFEPTLEALAEIGITNLETVYIGDAIRDQIAAKGAGVRFIGVTHGLTSSAEFEAAGAEYVDDLKKLIQVIK